MNKKVVQGNQFRPPGGPLQPIQFRRAAYKLRPDEVEAILDVAGGGVLVLDSERRIIYHNDMLGELLLSDGQSGVGLSCCDLICRVGAKATGCICEALLTQTPCEQRRQYCLAERQFEIVGTRVSSVGSKISKMVLVLNDITGKLEIDRMRSHFLSAAAHEILTPLAAILGYAELLSDQQLPKPVRREGLEIIQEKAEDLSRIVDNLLDTGRLEAGESLELTLEKFDVVELLKSVVKCCKNSVQLMLAEDPLMVLADRRRISQVVDNLISNAVKYSGPGAQIEISADQIGAELRLVIRDPGKGMGPEQLARGFETFYRGAASDSAPSGMGLGLGLTRHLVEAHDGSLKIQSGPGKGTRVCLTIPLAGPQKRGQLALFGTE